MAGPSRRSDGATPVRVVRVFTDESGRWGNPLGVVDGAIVPEDDRQRVAFQLGFSETIFIDDRLSGAMKIFTPEVELPLAGHPLVGAAWVLGLERSGGGPFELRPPGGPVQAWTDEEQVTWIEAALAPLPDWTLAELDSPQAVEQLTGPLSAAHDHVVYWAWISPGVLRARCFAPLFGIAEDEATGSGARSASPTCSPNRSRSVKATGPCSGPALSTPRLHKLADWS